MVQIREISPDDNQQIANVIRAVLIEHNVPKVGTAYADPELNDMFKAYQGPRSAYFVVVEKNEVIGGGGISPLQASKENICELQKMYFLERARGRGLGSRLIDICLEHAAKFKYEKCYLETMPYMKAAQKLYQRSGFTYLEAPMGNTGHGACPVWMIKPLT